MRDKIATSQLAFPEDACSAAYAMQGYEGSVGTLDRSLASDGVFRDGVDRQLATMTGNPSSDFKDLAPRNLEEYSQTGRTR